MGFPFDIRSDSPFVRDPFGKDFSPTPSKIDGYTNAPDLHQVNNSR